VRQPIYNDESQNIAQWPWPLHGDDGGKQV
jgi:hypothetical protein